MSSYLSRTLQFDALYDYVKLLLHSLSDNKCDSMQCTHSLEILDILLDEVQAAHEALSRIAP